ncbi:MAG TPA: hypothetical protein VHF51_14890, partial [Solirubrobacteraceae bacterium]|nr:hypothetical protein [Solirubrobacteraceae bacterium]
SARADIEVLRRERDRAVERATLVRAESAATAPLPVERGVHPEQDAAAPALPLPEGEEVGPPRPLTAAGRASNGDGRGSDGDDEPPTAVVEDRNEAGSEDPTSVRRARVEDDQDDGDWDDDHEGVRVLGPRPPRARTGDEPPVEPLPGTAEVGARHIVPGDMGRAGLGLWLARAAAILALAFVVAAVLLVVLGLQ